VDFSGKDADGNALRIRKKTHQTIHKVTEDIEKRMHFNTAIAAIMELVNELYSFYEREDLSHEEAMAIREALEALSLLLVPFAPHFAEEMRDIIAGKGLAIREQWPLAEERLLEEENVVIVIQVNGKLRGKVVVPKGSEDGRVFSLALEDGKIQSFLRGKSIVKKIYVQDKLLNIVAQ
jgi:leucyl-tRNA synthetase